MSKKPILIILLTVGICLTFGLTSQAATVISIIAEGALADVAGFEVIIDGPSGVTIADFTRGDALAGFSDFSIDPDILSFFSQSAANSIDTGDIGSFSGAVDLIGWELTNQAGDILELGDDYFVTSLGDNYVIAEYVVPIPSAILLLGGGLISLFAVRRRLRK